MQLELKNKRGNSLGVGCLCLFALPFAGFGVFALLLAVRELANGKFKEGLFLSLFGLVFSSVGFGIMIGAFYGGKKAAADQALREQSPDEPWKWREDWANGRIVSTNKQMVGFTWIFALLWNAISSFVFLALPDEIRKGNHPALIGLLFPLVGAGLLIWAIRATLRWRRYGASTFEMAAVPAPIGGQLSGLITTGAPLAPAGSVRLHLTCMLREDRGSDSSFDKLLWEEEKTLEADALQATGGIPVFFNLPRDAQPSASRPGSTQVKWMLTASAATPGVDYQAQFEVPVFHAALTAAEAASNEDPTARWQPQSAVPGHDAASGIDVQHTPDGGLELGFPAARHPGVGVSLLIFTAIWTGAIWLMLTLKAPLIFPIVFGLFDALLVMILVNVWFSSSRIVANAASLTVHKRTLFWGNSRELAVADVKEIVLHIGMTAGTKAYYDIKVVPREGRSFVAGSSIRGKRQADWLAGELRKALRLPADDSDALLPVT